MSWYAIYVKVGYEDAFCHYTDKMKERVYLGIEYTLLVPKRRIFERRQGKWNEELKTMFPGYVLINTDYILEFYLLARNSPYVIKFLKEDSFFLKVSEEEITPIIKMINNSGVIATSRAIIENGRIRIIEGPLWGREDYIKKVDKRKGRAKVKFVIGERLVLIDVGIEFIAETYL